MANEVLTVTELNTRIKRLLEAEFAEICVEGELSAAKQASSGHVYLTLKDSQASVDGVIWKTVAQRIASPPQLGDQVQAWGRVSVYVPRGTYNLVITRIEPAGRGALHAQFEALKARLAAEGLFDRERKRSLPFLPRGVGVVTSPTGAARRDIESIIHRRSPQIPIYLYPAVVQGPGAAPEVARGIEVLGRDPRVEVLIVGRGGGSLEDLWAFNEEIVARAVAACPKPVVSAVGHETDVTITDFVADLRAATPSEAAEKVVPVRDDLLYHLADRQERLEAALRRRVELGRARLGQLASGLRPAELLGPRRTRLAQLLGRASEATQRRLGLDRRRLGHLRQRLGATHPSAQLAEARRSLARALGRLVPHGPRRVHLARQRLVGARSALGPAWGRQHEAARARLTTATARLAALSPLSVLDRGYAIARSGGRVLRDATETVPGAELEIIVHRGQVMAQVTEVIAAPPASGGSQ